jgi:bile acid:Na+ symporter, BASS family
MKAFLDVAIPAVTVALTVVVGLDLSPADFDRVRRQPATVAAGLLGPLVLLPPIALGLNALFRPSPAAQAGLLLIASCPVGGISNTYNYLAGASTALSVTLTAASCLAAVATMPLLTRLFELALGRPFGFEVPATTLVVQLLVLLVVPVALGMAIRRWAPAFAVRNRRIFRLAAFAALAALIAFVVVAQREDFAREIPRVAPLAAALVVVAMAAGMLVASVLHAGRSDRFTLALEFGTRNVAIASAIAITVLGRLEFAVFAAIYFVTEAPIALVAVFLFRRGSRREA